MNGRNTTFLIAAALSVAIHAAMFSAFPRYEVRWAAPEWPATGSRVPEEMTIVLEPQPDLEPEPEAELEPAKRELPEFPMGAADGKGYATHEIPDKADAAAPEAEADQAFLSLDPAGAGNRGTDAAVAKATGAGSRRGQPLGSPPRLEEHVVKPPGPQTSPPQRPPATVSPPKSIPLRARVAVAAHPKSVLTPGAAEAPALRLESALTPKKALRPRAAAIASASPIPLVPSKDAVVAEPEAAAGDGVAEAAASPPEAHPELPSVPPAAPAAVPVPVEPRAVPATDLSEPKPAPIPVPSANDGGARTGGTQQPAADPARMSDSESDPFSRLGTAIIKDGRLDIRFGRKVKTRRPKLLLAAHLDLLSLRRAQVVLKIDIDETGKVTGVDILKSSGSNEIDQPTRVAIYEWWFEPKKDRRGVAVADQVQFTIAWR